MPPGQGHMMHEGNLSAGTKLGVEESLEQHVMSGIQNKGTCMRQGVCVMWRKR